VPSRFFLYFPTNEFLLPASSPTPTFTRTCVPVSPAGILLTNSISQASGRGLKHVSGNINTGLAQPIGEQVDAPLLTGGALLSSLLRAARDAKAMDYQVAIDAQDVSTNRKAGR